MAATGKRSSDAVQPELTLERTVIESGHTLGFVARTSVLTATGDGGSLQRRYAAALFRRSSGEWEHRPFLCIWVMTREELGKWGKRIAMRRQGRCCVPHSSTGAIDRQRSAAAKRRGGARVCSCGAGASQTHSSDRPRIWRNNGCLSYSESPVVPGNSVMGAIVQILGA